MALHHIKRLNKSNSRIMDNEWLTIENVDGGVILKKCSKKATGEIAIPNGVTSIGKGAFALCQEMTRVKIPHSVTSIGERAFWGCTGLKSVLIPKSVTVLGNSAFQHCIALRSATIGSGVTHLNEWTFSSCKNLMSVNLPMNISLGKEAFRDCENLSICVYDPYGTVMMRTEEDTHST